MSTSPQDHQEEGAIRRSSNNSLEEPLLETSEDEFQENEPNMLRLIDGMPQTTSIMLKSLYFLSGLSASTWGRYSVIYYNLHGLTPQHIGLLQGLMPIVKSISQPFWAFVVDHGCFTRKQIYLSCRILGTFVLLTLSLPWISKSTVRIFVVSLSTVTFSASGILYSYTLDLLGRLHKAKYGQYRVWCAISWGLGAVLMGSITDHFGFEPNFVIYGLLGVFSIALTAAYIPNKTLQEDIKGETNEVARVRDLAVLLCRPRVLVFFLELVIMGAGMGTVESLLFLYLINDLGASTMLCGLSVGVTVMLEIPLFWWSKWFIERMGHDGMFAVAMLCFVIRVVGYTWLTPSTVSWVLLLEVMHGITFALFWTAAMDISKVLSLQTKGWNTTVPVIISTLFQCVGCGSGSIFGGWAMHHFGSRIMYQWTATIVLATLIIHCLGCLATRFCLSTQSSFLSALDEQEPSNGQQLQGGQNLEGEGTIDLLSQPIEYHTAEDCSELTKAV